MSACNVSRCKLWLPIRSARSCDQIFHREPYVLKIVVLYQTPYA